MASISHNPYPYIYNIWMPTASKAPTILKSVRELIRKMNDSRMYLLVLLVLVGSLEMFNFCGADPTEGFTLVPLTESNFEIQKPYDIPLKQRYRF